MKNLFRLRFTFIYVHFVPVLAQNFCCFLLINDKTTHQNWRRRQSSSSSLPLDYSTWIQKPETISSWLWSKKLTFFSYSFYLLGKCFSPRRKEEDGKLDGITLWKKFFFAWFSFCCLRCIVDWMRRRRWLSLSKF